MYQLAKMTLSIVLFSLFLLLSSFSTAQVIPETPKALIFPIRKDGSTNQYYTTIQIGPNKTTLNVVVDLGGKFLWFNSDEYFSSAADSYTPILCGTRQCTIAAGSGCVLCLLSFPVPRCANNTCSDYSLNPFTGTQGFSGLAEDVLHVYSNSVHGTFSYNINNFPFQYSDPVLKQGLGGNISGIIGLGRTRISLPAQLASSAFKIRQKFALCIPSSSDNIGNMIFGQTTYSGSFEEIAKTLITTPLIRNPVSTYPNEVIGNLTVEYFINVRSIRIGEKILSFNRTLLSIDKKTGAGGTCIRTVRAYTSLHPSIYKPFVNEFVKSASSMNIKRVASVAPFGACFDSRTVVYGKTGPQVPTIDLLLPGENVYWRFYGSNTIVRVNNDVLCLAFVDGSPNLTGPTTSIVVGGYQLENHLLEFDVTSSTLRFGSSLLLRDTDCSHFNAS